MRGTSARRRCSVPQMGGLGRVSLCAACCLLVHFAGSVRGDTLLGEKPSPAAVPIWEVKHELACKVRQLPPTNVSRANGPVWVWAVTGMPCHRHQQGRSRTPSATWRTSRLQTRNSSQRSSTTWPTRPTSASSKSTSRDSANSGRRTAPKTAAPRREHPPLETCNVLAAGCYLPDKPHQTDLVCHMLLPP